MSQNRVKDSTLFVHAATCGPQHASYMTRKLGDEYKQWRPEISVEKAEYIGVGADGEALDAENYLIKKCNEF